MTTGKRLRGVIAAISTPFTAAFELDTGRFVSLAKRLLDDGCDGLNLCGTTGEATSMSVAQRKALMSAAAAALPCERLMAGTGAASLADTVELTRHAADLGFAAALLLPPFYYNPVTDEGVVAYFEVVAERTAASPVPLYLYHFPALSGVPFHPALVARLRDRLGTRLFGLKDSSGDLAYANEVAGQSKSFDVFPSNEATLLEARSGRFAGCISATANVSSALCAATYRNGNEQALRMAVAIRQRLSAGALIPSVKAATADLMQDDLYATVTPPLVALARPERERLAADLVAIRNG